MMGFKTATDRTGTTSATINIQFLRTILRGEALREFNAITNQVDNTTNGHLKLIKESSLSYFIPLNAPNKQKLAMIRTMRKPWDLLFKRFAAQLTELNNYLQIFPGSSAAKKMDPV